MNREQLPPEDTTYKRRKVIIDVIYFLMIFGASVLFVRYALPHLWSFVIALIVILILRTPVKKLYEIGFNYKATSVVSVLIFYGTIGVATSFLAIFIVNKLRMVIGGIPIFFQNTVSPMVSDAFDEIESFLELINEKFGIDLVSALNPVAPIDSSGIAGSVESSGIFEGIVNSSAELADPSVRTPAISLSNFSEDIVGLLTSAIATISKSLISNTPSIASSVSTVILNVVICIVSTAFGLMDFDFLDHTLHKIVPDKTYIQFKKSVITLGKVLWNYIKSYGLIMLITFFELAIGLFIIKRDTTAIAIAALIAVCDILPIIGSGLFLCPWAIIELVTGNIGSGIGLCILWIVLIIVRNIIEPKIVGDKVGMHPLLTLLAMIAGQFIYGGIGILLLPVSIALYKELIENGIIEVKINPFLKKNEYKEPEKKYIIRRIFKNYKNTGSRFGKLLKKLSIIDYKKEDETALDTVISSTAPDENEAQNTSAVNAADTSVSKTLTSSSSSVNQVPGNGFEENNYYPSSDPSSVPTSNSGTKTKTKSGKSSGSKSKKSGKK